MPRQITVTDLAKKLAAEEPIYLLDVRQDWENEIAALPDSLLIPLPQLPNRIAEIRPPKSALVVAYCHHGIRSLSAAAYLEQAGIENVVSLAGGIDAWSCEVDPGVRRY